MRVRLRTAGSRYDELDDIVRTEGLHTVCEEARCPNIGECWGRGTATFQIMGDTCTRACRYCAVNSSKRGDPLDPLEPGRLAAAAQRMGLRHVVVTSVDRDDLDDRGAEHWARTIRALRRRLPDAGVEVLTPDFLGREEEALVTVLGAHPHRVQPQHRDRAPHPAARAHQGRLRAGALAPAARARGLGRALARARPADGQVGHRRRHGRDGRRDRRDARRPARARRRRRHDRPVPAADRAPPAARPLGAARLVPPLPRGRRADGLRLRLLRPPRALVLPRRGAAARRHAASCAPARCDCGARRPALRITRRWRRSAPRSAGR